MSSIHFLAPIRPFLLAGLCRVIQAFAALTISQGLPLPPDPLQYGVLGTQLFSGYPCLHGLVLYLNMYIDLEQVGDLEDQWVGL